MNLSELPLMPSAEVPEVVPAPVQAGYADSGWQRAEPGCGCPSCERLRERDQTRAAHPPAVNPQIWFGDISDPTASSAFDPYTAFAAVTSTGRISASSPQIQRLPRSAPTVQENRRIRGRYTEDFAANTVLAGHERWLDPTTGRLYSTGSIPACDNSGFTSRTDGTWVSQTGMIWEEVRHGTSTLLHRESLQHVLASR